MAQGKPFHGNCLVALEGLSEDALETQLRLLPVSPSILVLPSIQHYLDADKDSSTPPPASSSPFSATAAPFDARRYIHRVHNAATTRRDAALAFLKAGNSSVGQLGASNIAAAAPDAPVASRRLVFLNGGTATSHALCIEAIQKNDPEAGGSLEHAAAVFDRLVAQGVAGLSIGRKQQPQSSPATATQSRPPSSENAVADDNDEGESMSDVDDPITKAMRAADTLDRKTEGLQPSTHVLDLTIGNAKPPRPRSLSLPIDEELLDLLAAGHRLSQISALGDERIMARGTVPVSPSRFSPTSTIFPASMRFDAIAAQEQYQQQMPQQQSPRTVILGPAPRGRPRRRTAHENDNSTLPQLPVSRQQRARSLERALSTASMASGDGSIAGAGIGLGLQTFFNSNSREASSTRPRRPSNVSDASSSASLAFVRPRPFSEVSAGILVPDVPLLPDADTLERMARGSKAVSQQPRLLRLKTAASRRALQTATYVDRGTDAGPDSRAPSSHFEPVLPIFEDLVVHFEGTINGKILAGTKMAKVSAAFELALQRCRESVAIKSMQDEKQAQEELAANRPTVALSPATAAGLPATPESSSPTVQADDTAVGSTSADDYDPFAPHEYNARPKPPAPPKIPLPRPPPSPMTLRTTIETAKATPQLPTPAHTPPLGSDEAPKSSQGKSDRHSPQFHALSAASHESVLALHNTLRATLGSHLQSATDGDVAKGKQSKIRLLDYLPGMDNAATWAPLFSDDTNTATIATAVSSRIDMILAVGCQSGVPSTLTTKVMSQLGRIGERQDAASVNSRVDLRYLLVNVMQVLAKQEAYSRVAQSAQSTTVLAALLMAQLDLYLRCYKDVRFILLDYPLELLSIVLAMQKLAAGRDVLAVQAASIVVDGRGSRAQAKPQLQGEDPDLVFDPEHPPVARADYILTASAASDADVALFVATVRKHLLSSNPSATYYEQPAVPQPPTSATSRKGSSNVSSPMMPAIASSTPTSLRRTRSSSENDKRVAATTGAPAPPVPGAKKPAPATVNGTRQPLPPKSPAPSSVSQRSMQSMQSMQSLPSQADSWRSASAKLGVATTATTPTSAVMAGLMPAPQPPVAALPTPRSGARLVAKTIQVTGPSGASTNTGANSSSINSSVAANLNAANAARRVVVKESNSPVAASTATIVRPSTSGTTRATSPPVAAPPTTNSLSNWDDGLDVSEDGNYTYDDVPPAAGGSRSTTVPSSYTTSYAADEYIDDDEDDDLENDLDMRRLMPLFMRDRAALLAAKERRATLGAAIGAGGGGGGGGGTIGGGASVDLQRRSLARSKTTQLTGATFAPDDLPKARAVSSGGRVSSSTSSVPFPPPPPPPVTRSRTATTSDMLRNDYYYYQTATAAEAAAKAGAGTKKGGLRSKASRSSMRSQSSNGKGLSDGKKALRLLGLA